jgi:hypothetical protein
MQDMFAGLVAVAPTRALANSAMPDAPVVADSPRPAGRRLRRSTAWRLRRLADRLAPA